MMGLTKSTELTCDEITRKPENNRVVTQPPLEVKEMKKPPQPKLVFAFDRQGGIAKEGKIPWSCPEDMKMFKNLTSLNIVLMGRKTWESLPVRPLSNRENIVVTRDSKDRIDGVKTVNSLSRVSIDPLLEEASKGGKSLFVIGGKEIYEGVIALYPESELYITFIDVDHHCDLFLWPWLAKRILNELGDKTTSVYNIDYKVYNPCLVKDREVVPGVYLFKGFNSKKSSERKIQDLIYKVYHEGESRLDRTGVGTVSIFGAQLEIDIGKRFPLMTVRKTFFKGIFEELVWFLRGIPDSKILEDKKVNVWKGNSTREYLDKYKLDYEEGDCGPHYPHQWRHWGAPYEKITKERREKEEKEGIRETSNIDRKGGIDQVQNVIDTLRRDPTSRRMIISGWNVSDLSRMALPPCHVLYQFGVHNGKLNVHFFQRSSDTLLALHWNLSSAALFVYLLSSIVDIPPGKVVMSISDAHIYTNHLSEVGKILSRRPYEYPKLEIVNKREKIEDYVFEDLKLSEYRSYPSVELPMNA